MKLPLTKISATHRALFFDSLTKTISADISDLGNISDFTKRIYDDACDVGFVIFNPKTRNEVTFCLEHVDVEEDVYGWNFTPAIEDVRKNPSVEGWKVLIIND